MFGGENNTSLANDLWTLRGLGLDGEESPSWFPLELPGTAPAPRKGHACASKPSLGLCFTSMAFCTLAGIQTLRWGSRCGVQGWRMAEALSAAP